MDAAHRLWDRIEKMPSGCWEWQGFRNADGYGQISWNGKHWRTHRLAYALTLGHIPEGLHVLHRCDNPPCCNPDHLFIGTDADNTADKITKNRWRGGQKPGESNSRAKLTSNDVRAIRARYAAGNVSIKQIALEYGAGQSTISALLRGEIWKGV